MMNEKAASGPDVVLVGGGIMSATLGVLLKELQPGITLTLIESLDNVGAESSDPWNNAGTGHSALCELNYTPEQPDGRIDIAKAVTISESFCVTRQFWAWLVEQGFLPPPERFINAVPHMTFVHGADGVGFLRKRFEALSKHHAFQDMQFTDDGARIAEWAPLIMDQRPADKPIAATRSESGTDVDFGALTRMLVDHLARQNGTSVLLGHRVAGVHRQAGSSRWCLKVRSGQEVEEMSAGFVFLGAGGGALPLLQRSGIPEGKGFGGFPISGQWLICDNPKLAERHHAKVYGRAAIGAPPMSVPHLDTRLIGGKRGLLFGPFAGFSTRFLKRGSLLDLPASLRGDNLVPMLSVARDNMDLIKYLIGQVLQSPSDRLKALQEFLPTAVSGDWHLAIAGQRVQIIKKDPKRGGVLQFGTEVVSAADGSIAALLGASPGASTAVPIMLELIQRCFAEQLKSPEWQAKLKKMIPSYGQSLAKDAGLYNRTHARTWDVLGLKKH
jgi:malate dehydrogenase (quinone)